MDAATDKLGLLKGELAERLASDSTDFGEILRLSAEIGRLEPGVVRFSTDAAMVRRLGRELVAKQETALAELVKNAYDADATYCTVTLHAEGPDASMRIEDDGEGMTRADVERGFMRLASDEKVKEPMSPRYGRSRAGKKGIGRFATERLGGRLRIVTQTEGEGHGWSVVVDWAAFAQGLDLGLVANAIAECPKERPKGTTLTVEGLNDAWSDAELRRVYRYLSTIIEPFAENVGGRAPGTADDRRCGDPGFEARLSRAGDDVLRPDPIANVDSQIFGNAVAVIDASIGPDGSATWSLTSDKLDVAVDRRAIGLDRNRPTPLRHARNVTLRAHYFIRVRELLGHSTAFITEQLRLHGGIRLYRNGYRVPPYGERDDDWLGLDYKRTNTYAPINSKVFLGFVALDDPDGAMFEETSSREGLIETEAFAEVRDVMSAVLEAAVLRIESERGKGRRKRGAGDKAEGRKAADAAGAAVAEVKAVFDGPAGASVDPAERERAREALSRLGEAVQVSVEVVQERDDLLKELNLLRILASMGLTIAEFTHDFSHLAQTMTINAAGIRKAATPDQLEAELAKFDRQFSQVRAYTSHFGNMMTNNASRDLQAIDLYDFARLFQEDLAPMFARRGLQLEVERPAEYDIFTTRMHRSEWSSILLNLLTNAVKAIKRAFRPGRILIRVGAGGPGTVFLEFCDNGDGIPEGIRGSIFDAFFTTGGGSSARAPDTVQSLGTGLGLKIVADIVEAVGGGVRVGEAPEGYATCIRIEVPAGVAEGEAGDPA